jgi:hypothetical protein
MAKSKFAVGDTIVFNGYDADTPEEDQVLEQGTSYTVAELGADNSLVVEIPNPDFNAKRKESENNAKTLLVDVFEEEVSLANDDEEDEAEEAPAPKKTAAKTVAKTVAKKAPVKKTVAAEEEEEDEEEAPVKKAPVKAAAKKAPATKAPVKKTAAKTVAKTVAKKAPVKVQKEEVDEDDLPDLENEDEEVLALVNDADDVLELAQELVEEGAALDYRLGGVLYHVRKEKAYQQADERYTEKGGFGLYVKEKLNVEYRKAMYLIDIYVKFNLFGISGEKVAEIGWTKASKIAAVMNDGNAEDLVALAEEQSVSDLNDTIKESYKVEGATGGEKVKRITFKFRLIEDSADFVQETLNQCAASLGTKDLSAAFEHIIGEWAAEHANLKTTAKRGTTKATTKAPTKTTARRGKAVEEEGEE